MVSASAQDSGLGGFFSHLFAPSQSPPSKPADAAPTPTASTPTAHKPKRKPRDFVPVTTTRASSALSPVPVQATHFIEVLGDSLAISAAEGLSETLADKTDLGVVDKARDASGLVREDYFDWAKAAAEIAASKEKIDFAVILIGINDMQPLRDGADYVEPLKDRWRELYSQRIEAIVAPVPQCSHPGCVGWPAANAVRTL